MPSSASGRQPSGAGHEAEGCAGHGAEGRAGQAGRAYKRTCLPGAGLCRAFGPKSAAPPVATGNAGLRQGGSDVGPSLLEQACAGDSSAAVAWRFTATTREANHQENPFQRVSMLGGFSPRGRGSMAEAGGGKPVETGWWGGGASALPWR